VYKKAVHILETYFGLDDDEDDALAPTTQDNGYVFDAQAAPPAPMGGFQFG